jgi:hypothetical protein
MSSARNTGAMAALLAVGAIALPACGGDDGDDVSPAPGAEGAEQRVRDYLTAQFEGDAETACGYVSDDFQQQLAEVFGSCEQVINLVSKEQPTFEDEPIKLSEVDDLELETAMEGDDHATVTGPTGEQEYVLDVMDGEWIITFIGTD